MPIIPATQKTEAGGLKFKASLGNSDRTYLKKMGVGGGDVAQCKSSCLACAKPWIQSPGFPSCHSHTCTQLTWWHMVGVSATWEADVGGSFELMS